MVSDVDLFYVLFQLRLRRQILLPVSLAGDLASSFFNVDHMLYREKPAKEQLFAALMPIIKSNFTGLILCRYSCVEF